MAWISWDKLCAPKACGGMGFKQLKEFNLAMYAKQGWRLQTGVDSLLVRVFKAKYFPNSDFKSASLGSNPSYAWRSLMAAQVVVKEGSRWQVGNGRSTRIWKDKWFPSPSTYRVISPISILPQDARVESLIDRENGVWKNELVRQVFLPHETDTICGIVLSASQPVDKQVWAPTTNGIFNARSAYKIAKEMGMRADTGALSDGSRMRCFWKHLWRCNVPHKVRHLIWRACRDILPTKANLVARKVLLDSCCEE